MKHRHRSVQVLGATIILMAAVVGVWWIQRPPDLSAHVPPVPPADELHPALARTLPRLTERVRTGEDRVAALAELSRYYHINGFLEEARICYGGLITHEGDEPRWFHRLAEIVAGYGFLEDAVPLWAHVRDHAPTFLVAPVRQGEALLKLNDPEGAREALSAVIAQEPENPWAHVGLARAAIAEDDWTTARDHLERAVAASNDRIGVDLLATVYREIGRDEEARLLLRTTGFGGFTDIRDPWMEELLPYCYDPDRLATAGGSAAFHTEFDKGLRLLQRAAELAPDDPMIHYQLGYLALQIRQYDIAFPHLDKSVELDPSLADGWLRLYEWYLEQDQPGRARAILTAGLREAPRSPSLLIAQALRYRDDGRTTEAARLLREAGEIQRDQAHPFVLLSQLHFGEGAINAGMAALERALEAEPGNTVALTTLTLARIQTGAQRDAAELLRMVRRHPRVEPDMLARLEQAYAEQFGGVLPPREG